MSTRAEDPSGRHGGAAAQGGPPRSVEEALAKARHHARNAAAEALRAAHAALDAAAFATRGEPAATHPWFGRVSRMLEELGLELGGDGAMAETLLHAVAEALDVEIERWEKRAREDADARAVLRAFLGLREVLWEFGVRQRGAPPAEPERPTRSARSPRRGTRVQRVPVES